jgi:transketolase
MNPSTEAQVLESGCDTFEFSRAIRRDVLRMVHRAKASHVGSCYSVADIMAVLYCRVLHINRMDPAAPDRDRFVLSKGHAAAIVYATLSRIGVLPRELLDTYGEDGSLLMTHASHKVAGVEFSSGSLGHGLPFGAGKALAARRSGKHWRTFVLLSDGEMDEGSNWEALMFAAHHRLDNLTAIIDYNKLQSLDTISNTLGLEPLVAKLEAFGARVAEIDGHDHAAICSAVSGVGDGRPCVVVAHTIKGKGISFMENQVKWHYRSPNAEELAAGLAELGAGHA